MKSSIVFSGKKIFLALLAVMMLPVLGARDVGKAIALEPKPADSGEKPDKTLSPYFFVKSDDSSLDQLPLKSTSALVNVSGIIADVTVTQVYKNEGKKPIEAIYVFPASTRTAVYGMKMTIGERTITARIQKREEARQAYEQAKKEGKSASLLEQNRPNVFQMNVANILPGDEIRTELSYTELMVPTDGVYEFAYPTVVGPRYSNAPESTAPPSEKWSQNPYLHQGEAPTYAFDITVNVAAGMDIQEMACPSHKVNINYKNKGLASVELDPSEKSGGNRDYILKYRLSGNQISSGLLLFEGQKENFFLLMMEPPRRVTPANIPPREYIFIVDVSGSMHGFPLDISKKLFKDLAAGLRPIDSFNVLLFSGGSQVLSEKSLPAGEQNVQRAIKLIEQQQGGGGTELLPALRRALTLPRTEGASRTIVIATDGYVTVEPEVFDLMNELLGNANFFTFGIGSSVNRHLLEGMARIGAGEPFVITRPDEAPAAAQRFRKYIQSPILTQTRLDFGKFETYDVEPAGVPDLFAERPVIVYGKWRGKPQGEITLFGTSGEGKYQKQLDVSQVKPLAENSALRYLWARSRITRLGDYNNLGQTDERVRQITELGLDYNLLTAYTSFVAIDSEVRRKGEDATTVKQPLPLPQGVSDNAVGGEFRKHMALAPASPATGYGGGPSPRTHYKGGRPGGVKMSAKEQSRPDASGRGGSMVEEQEVSASGIKIVDLKVQGGLSEKIVKQFILQGLERFPECIRKSGAKLSGATLSITFTVGPNGAIKNVRISRERGDAPGLKCLTEQVERWSFPAPKDGKEVQVVATVSITK
ncbi:MAG: VIT domain-containing protein [Syntrophobacteraceae bacterium]